MINKPFTSNDLFAMSFTGNPKLSPDGSKALYEVTEVSEKSNTYLTNIWLWNGERNIPFTTGSGDHKTKNLNAKWSPNGESIAFVSNRSDNNQIWINNANNGESFKVTNTPVGVSDYCWTPDSSGIYYLAKERKKESKFNENATVTHITKLRYKFNGKGLLDNIPEQLYYVDIATLQVKQLSFDKLGAAAPVVSPDNKYLAFSLNRNEDELDLKTDIYVLNIAEGTIERVTPHNGRYSAPIFMPNGDILCTGIEKYPYPGGYNKIWQINIATKSIKQIGKNYNQYIGKSVGSDIASERGNSGLTVSKDGQYVYFVITEKGNCFLERINLQTEESERVIGDGSVVVSSYDVSGDKIIANLADPESPCDIWYGDSTELERITYLNEELFKDKYIALPEQILFESPEGVTLEGWILKPIDFKEGEKHPLVMQIHGGPHSSYGNIFFHEFQILAGNGYAVFYANPRGSLGYSEDFSRAIIGDWCGCDTRDLEFMAREVSKLNWVDEKHMAVTGGSQGGYFTNWLISHCDLFSAAVTQRSMSNLYTKYGIADNGWNGDRYGMGGADLWDKEDFVLERSPIRYAPNVNTPLLIIHSDKDYRCPLEQAEQWYVALKRLGNITEMLIFHDEHHGLSRVGKPANRIVRLDAIVDWFGKYC
ncbi:S9 family peptidase [Clostridium sp. 'deep sea']|uniref:S9 family peptidase n=1 Tax=Clostridium sp. 'deep sea' TaxID=2779445 RepID=UPI0018964535|nr:S9 family peptidase [Clostridium sp. 'deep sea']QOR36097.1 S9 family peptidase [Clostridium sp. 'deep sea']